jgi:hypothetical protein
MQLAAQRGQKAAAIVAPDPILALVIRYQGAGELIGIGELLDFSEQIPARTARIEGIQDHIAALGVVKGFRVTAIGIGNDGPIAAGERPG